MMKGNYIQPEVELIIFSEGLYTEGDAGIHSSPTGQLDEVLTDEKGNKFPFPTQS